MKLVKSRRQQTKVQREIKTGIIFKSRAKNHAAILNITQAMTLCAKRHDDRLN